MDIRIHPVDTIQGTIELPTSKSQTLRALFSCLFVKGTVIIYDALEADDSSAMINALSQFGLRIIKKKQTLIVHSPGFRKLKAPLNCYVGSSGIALRFLSAFSAFFKTKVTFYGSNELQTQRSIVELERGLKELGVKVKSNKGYCPFSVQGPIKNRECTIKGLDSQPISSLLWVLGSVNKKCLVKVLNANERPWINLTLTWLKKQNKKIYHKNFSSFHIFGKKKIKPFIYEVPKDFSSASFMIGLGLFAGHPIHLPGLDFKDPQGDKKLIYILKQAGAKIERKGDQLNVFCSDLLNLKTIDVKDIIDALPIVSAVSVLSQSTVKIVGASGARGKESDRIAAMKKNLTALGLTIEEHADGLTLHPQKISGGTCEGYKDHRIAMATAILAARSLKPIDIKGAECVSKTYPQFFDHLKSLGFKIEVLL